MAIKKTELSSSLWQSCDEPRDGMDASQYKNYILTFLFIMKYVSDNLSEGKCICCSAGLYIRGIAVHSVAQLKSAVKVNQ